MQQHPEGLEAARIKIPSESWILYQISPKHPSYAASLHYTGKANIKNKVQLRTLRSHHIDSHYCAAIKKYIKHMGVRAATVIESHTPDDEEPACVSFYSLDDKAKVCRLYVNYPPLSVYSTNALYLSQLGQHRGASSSGVIWWPRPEQHPPFKCGISGW
jgi:hypothetical protein